MTDELWTVVITAILAPNITAFVSHMIQSNKLNHITDNTNNTLSQVSAKKENAEIKLEQNLLTQLAAEKTKVSDLEKQLALQTPLPPTGKEDKK